MRSRLIVAAVLLAGFVLALVAQQLPEAPATLVWAPDGRLLAASGGLLARFSLDSEDDDELLSDAATAFALSPDGARLAVADLDGLTLRSYSNFHLEAALDSPAPPAAGPADAAGPILAVAWSPDGATVAAGTDDGHILLWDADTRQLWADLGVDPAGAVASLSFSADGARLLSGFDDGRAVLWDVAARAVVKTFSAPDDTASARSVLLSPDGRHILSTLNRGMDWRIQLLDDTGKKLWERAGRGAGFTSDGAAVLALAPPFRIAALYSASDAEALRIFEPPRGVEQLYAVALSPDGKQLVAAATDSNGELLLVWNFETGRVLKTRR